MVIQTHGDPILFTYKPREPREGPPPHPHQRSAGAVVINVPNLILIKGTAHSKVAGSSGLSVNPEALEQGWKAR